MNRGGSLRCLLQVLWLLSWAEAIVNLDSGSLHYRLIPNRVLGDNEVHICQPMHSIPNGVLQAISRIGTWPIDEPRVVNYQLSKALPNQELERKNVAG